MFSFVLKDFFLKRRFLWSIIQILSCKTMAGLHVLFPLKNNYIGRFISVYMGLNIPLFSGYLLSQFPQLLTLGLKSVLQNWSFVAFMPKVPPFCKF